MKREGRTLTISVRGRKLVLDGTHLRSLKKLLRDVGEIGGRINSKRCQVGTFETIP